jgi:hypothetical protein
MGKTSAPFRDLGPASPLAPAPRTPHPRTRSRSHPHPASAPPPAPPPPPPAREADSFALTQLVARRATRLVGLRREPS